MSPDRMIPPLPVELGVSQMSRMKKVRGSRSDRAPDAETVKRVLEGDQDAFGEIYDAYFRRVFAYALKRVGDRTEAEDLTQETFTQLYRSLESYEGRSSLLTWTFGIAQNVCSRYFRHRSRWMVGSRGDIALDERQIESTSERRVDAVRVLDHCDRVLASSRRPSHQEIFHLRYGESQSIRAIAGKVGKTKDAVKVSLRRSRAALADGVPELNAVLENISQSA
jgi:RNA polymerase sigma-70 factor (ECF subfamily)